MLKVEKILFPTDFSKCSLQALEHAVLISKFYKCELHIISIITMFEENNSLENSVPALTEMYKMMMKDNDQKFSDLIAQQKESDFKIVTNQIRGISISETILDYASEQNIDLIIMGTHGRRGIEHIFMGSVAEEVVHYSKCPVLTIREEKQHKPIFENNKILLPVDFSDHSKSALIYASEIQKIYDMEIELLHVYETSTHPIYFHGTKKEIEAFNEKIRGRAKTNLEKLVDEAGLTDKKVSIHFREGHVTSEIIDFANDSNSDLIIISSHGISGIERFLLGSIAEKVVRRSPCPVLTVKSFGKSLI